VRNIRGFEIFDTYLPPPNFASRPASIASKLPTYPHRFRPFPRRFRPFSAVLEPFPAQGLPTYPHARRTNAGMGLPTSTYPHRSSAPYYPTMEKKRNPGRHFWGGYGNKWFL
jgi:hypothetical protein